ncbi:TetR family transcriptional regulator [Bosea sp. AK1]|jgi:AcrR family transcriptional regulator|uniref:TetR/AcrR family transcriptional regulator n=1 Tax=Bosea sp. AK1 TaxID=2587160 RepID=UPI0011749BB9|nr:TetR/AcrR family transcriptional regulator [Bosea sp. AK1]TQI76099.1 TetR family transcriptional regulator [Bosea sp. AK1]
MARRLRADMIAETRASLIAAGREAFGTIGYAAASMDELTAAAGLTRGALYHHFGDKKGLFAAVLDQIDAEMTVRLRAVSAKAEDRWTGFRDECAAYLAMALEPEIQRITLRDGPAVLGDPWSWPIQNDCIRMMTRGLDELVTEGVLAPLDPEAVARLIFGATQHAAQWIAHAPEPEAALKSATDAFDAMLDGLLSKPT